MLRYIAILIGGFLSPLQVLLVYERLDALLDHANTGREAGARLRDHLLDEQVVFEHLTRLHRAYNGRLHVELAVLFDRRVRLLLLLRRVLLYRSRDLELGALVAVGHVERQHTVAGDSSGSRASSTLRARIRGIFSLFGQEYIEVTYFVF